MARLFFFTNLPGHSNTVCFKDTASEIINDKCMETEKKIYLKRNPALSVQQQSLLKMKYVVQNLTQIFTQLWKILERE